MEMLVQYLWKTGMFGIDLRLPSGEPVRILNPGLLNTDAGPDFFNAKIRIGEQEWIGNIEIHVKASDWYRHGHDRDMAYDSVILHVVCVDDAEVFRANGDRIPQVVVTVSPECHRIFTDLQTEMRKVKCSRRLHLLSSLHVADWVESLSMERLHGKASRVMDELNASHGDWNTACFITLARALGFGLNSQPFEMLARSLPLNYVRRHSDSLMQTEALLFGQAGMLSMTNCIFDEYYQTLCREYMFLSAKYGLHPIRSDIWKYARTRPQNMPHRRIAILASALVNGDSLLREIVDSGCKESRLDTLFSWEMSDYWKSHYGFDSECGKAPSVLSASSRRLLMINLAAPLYFAYHLSRGDFDRAQNAVELLESLPPEKNSIVSGSASFGIKAENAFQSQGLIHLRKEYCDKNRCLECRFGHKIILKSVNLPVDYMALGERVLP